jgi:enoyl-CoA hydratase/carnithine racemase
MPISRPDILLYEKKDRIVTITLNRPESMNALNVELMRRLLDAWRRFDGEDDAWVAVLTGAGDKAFCSGADLAEFRKINEKGPGTPDWPKFYQIPTNKPVIAAINGHAIAGGFALAQACDIRIASEKAEFGVAETRWNIKAGWVYSLTRQMGLGHALEIALWGDARISAQRAYEIGFVNRVVSPGNVMDEAMSWAERMLTLGPRCVRNLKEILYKGCYLTPEEAEAFGDALETNLVGMEDTVEGAKSFFERRKPTFKNR